MTAIPGVLVPPPSLVRSRIRSDSNSATTARTLNGSRPIGPLGSWTAPPMLSLTFFPSDAELTTPVDGGRAMVERKQQ